MLFELFAVHLRKVCQEGCQSVGLYAQRPDNF